MQLWLVLKIYDTEDIEKDTTGVEVVGVFENEVLGVGACTTRSHWICPLTMNEAFPDEPMDIPGSRFPVD